MKIYLMIAPCAIGKNIIGGQISKNKTLYKYLSERNKVILVDTYWEKKNIFQFVYCKFIRKLLWIFKIFICLRPCDKIILGSNNSNYIRLLDKINCLHKTVLFAIGGRVSQKIQESGVAIEIWNSLASIYVESPKIVDSMKFLGLENVSFLPNFKYLPCYEESCYIQNKKILELFYHGRICIDKGSECLIKAVNMANKEGKICKLYLYGICEEGFHIKNYINDDIIYKGKINLVDSLEDYEILKMHDIFIFPSQWGGEGLAASLEDALALGKPVIATRHNFNEMLVKDGYNGYLFEKGDVNGLAERIRFFYENQRLIYEMGNNSLKEADKYRIDYVLKDVF